MFDPYVWNAVDGTLYIARESFLHAKQRDQDEATPSLRGKWNEHLVIRKVVSDLRHLPTVGEA